MKARSFGKKIMRGVSTLEILIAFAILSLTLTAAILVVFSNQSVSIDTQLSDEALSRAQAQLELARAQATQTFPSTGTTTTYEILGGIKYTKNLVIGTTADPDIERATSIVSWFSSGRNSTTTLVTLLTNPAGGNACTPTVSDVNAWKNPVPLKWDMGQMGVNGNSGNGFGISNLAVFKGKIYMTMYNTANSGVDADKTFFAFDLGSNPSQHPTVTGGIILDSAFPPHTNSGTVYSANEIAIGQIGNKTYAFVANATSLVTGQLQVIDVSNPQPAWIKNVKVPSNSGYGNSIFYKSGYVYLGLTSAGGANEFVIYDAADLVGSLPTPLPIGGYTTGGHAVNSIYVKGDYAYIATPNNVNPANEIMTIIDVKPGSPTFAKRVGGWIDTANLPGSANDHGEKVFVNSAAIYLGKTYGTNELAILNAPTPASVSLAGSTDIGAGNGTSIYGLAVRGNLAFTTTASKFQVWDITGGNVQPWATLDLSTLGGTGSQLDCVGNYFYLPLASTQGGQFVGQSKDLLGVITANTYKLSNDALTGVSATQGSSANVDIARTFVSGFPQSIALSATGLPTGASASFTNNPCTGTCTSTLTINTTLSTPAATYPITVSGPGGVSTQFNLTVNTQAFNYTLSTPANVTLVRGGASANTTINATLSAGTTQSVSFANSGLPTGVTMNSLTSCNPTCSRTITLQAAASAATGAQSVTITGSPLSKSASFVLTINAPLFDYSLSSSPGNLTLSAGQSKTQTITVQMTPGAVPQSVGLSFSDSKSGVTFTPVTPSCTPSPSTYSCAITVTVTATAGFQNGKHTVTVTGNSPTRTTSFSIN